MRPRRAGTTPPSLPSCPASPLYSAAPSREGAGAGGAPRAGVQPRRRRVGGAEESPLLQPGLPGSSGAGGAGGAPAPVARPGRAGTRRGAEERSGGEARGGGVCSAGQPRSRCLSFHFIYFLSCAYRAAPAAPRLRGPRCRRGRSGAPGKAGIPVTPTPAPTPPPAPNATESGVRLKMPPPKLEERKGLMNRGRKPEEEPPQKI